MPGPKSHHKVYHRNPNPTEGCLCSPDAKQQDCKGPFVAFTHTEVVSGRNPYPVIGIDCLLSALKKCRVDVDPPPAPAVSPLVPGDVLASASTAELLTALQAHVIVPAGEK